MYKCERRVVWEKWKEGFAKWRQYGHQTILGLNHPSYIVSRKIPSCQRTVTICLWLMHSYWYAKFLQEHDDVIKWKHFPPLVRGIHRSSVNYPYKGQWRETLMFSLICTWTNGWFDRPLRPLWRNCNENTKLPSTPREVFFVLRMTPKQLEYFCSDTISVFGKSFSMLFNPKKISYCRERNSWTWLP